MNRTLLRIDKFGTHLRSLGPDADSGRIDPPAIDVLRYAMPQDRLQLRFIDDFDGTGKLLADVSSAGFSGRGGAYFNTDEIVELAESLAAYPLPDAAPLCIAGGFGTTDASGQLEQEHLALKVYPIDGRGHIGIQVRLSSELWPGMRPESQMSVKTQIVTTYEPLAQFSRELKALVRGSAIEAVLLGEEI